jgi:Family of unknown function (DUF6220)
VFRVLYALTAWLFLAGLVIQIFLIGVYLFSDRSALSAHQGLGWVLHLAPLVVLLFAFLARAGRRHWLWALALTVVVLIVPILAAIKDSVPVAAALHPLAAVVAFALACVVAWNSYAALRLPDETTPAG